MTLPVANDKELFLGIIFEIKQIEKFQTNVKIAPLYFDYEAILQLLL